MPTEEEVRAAAVCVRRWITWGVVYGATLIGLTVWICHKGIKENR